VGETPRQWYFRRSAPLRGYLGYFTLHGKLEFAHFAELLVRRLHLPASITLKDGSIIKGTSKYGIGFRSVDRALLGAAELGDVQAVRKTMAEGADVNCIDPNDRVATPIVHAAQHGHLEIVKLLLASRANPNARNIGSNTALMLAARFGHIDIVRALLAGGADVNAEDRDGGTALDNAREHPHIQRLLKQAGGQSKAKAPGSEEDFLKPYQCQNCFTIFDPSELNNSFWQLCPHCGNGHVTTRPMVTCPACHAMLRVSKGKEGTIRCPQCVHQFHVKA
jgi:uncharacterized protein